MAKVIKINKGLDISLKGKAVQDTSSAGFAEIWSLTPGDYYGLVPRVEVSVGDSVKTGTPLMTDKNHPEINFVSPVSGTVADIVRGEKRKLLNILIKADSKTDYLQFSVRNPLELAGEEVKSTLCTAGLWPYLKQRPYDVIANPGNTPKAIFVTGFDTSPLAPDYDFLLKGQAADLQAGLNALCKLTEGKVYLSVPVGCKSTEMKNAANVEVRFFDGPHPAGNVGVQINHIDPVNKGEVIWTANALDVLLIGRFFNKGIVDLTRMVALTGPEVRNPQYIRCKSGIPIKALLEGNVYKEIPLRYINGNVFTGTEVNPDGYLGAYSNQLTVLHEGTDIHEFIGWVMPRLDKFSSSRTYFAWLYKLICPKKAYEPDTRVLGGERALIMSGEYDRVFPMDILPEQLVRACITGDLERMENLGIYEVAPEDFALCEYVCTSKIEVQKVVREALDMLKKENGD